MTGQLAQSLGDTNKKEADVEVGGDRGFREVSSFLQKIESFGRGGIWMA